MAHSIRWFPSRCWVSLIFQFVNCYVPNIQAIFVDSSRLSSRTISGLAFTNFCLRCRWPSNGGKQMWPFKPQHLMRNLQHDFTYVFLLESVCRVCEKKWCDITYTPTHLTSAHPTFSHLTSAHPTFENLTSVHLTVYYLHSIHFNILHLHILHITFLSSLSLSLCFSLSRFLSCADWCQAPKRWSKRCRCSCTCIFTVKCAELGQAPKSYKHIHIYMCVCMFASFIFHIFNLHTLRLHISHLHSLQLTSSLATSYIFHLSDDLFLQTYIQFPQYTCFNIHLNNYAPLRSRAIRRLVFHHNIIGGPTTSDQIMKFISRFA